MVIGSRCHHHFYTQGACGVKLTPIRPLKESLKPLESDIAALTDSDKVVLPGLIAPLIVFRVGKKEFSDSKKDFSEAKKGLVTLRVTLVTD